MCWNVFFSFLTHFPFSLISSQNGFPIIISAASFYISWLTPALSPPAPPSTLLVLLFHGIPWASGQTSGWTNAKTCLQLLRDPWPRATWRMCGSDSPPAPAPVWVLRFPSPRDSSLSSSQPYQLLHSTVFSQAFLSPVSTPLNFFFCFRYWFCDWTFSLSRQKILCEVDFLESHMGRPPHVMAPT